jgi:hypothetical protein
MKQTMIAVLVLLSATAASAQTQEQREACMPDYQKLCSSVLPGGGRILKCLRDHSADITERCRTAIASATPPK